MRSLSLLPCLVWWWPPCRPYVLKYGHAGLRVQVYLQNSKWIHPHVHPSRVPTLGKNQAGEWEPCHWGWHIKGLPRCDSLAISAENQCFSRDAAAVTPSVGYLACWGRKGMGPVSAGAPASTRRQASSSTWRISMSVVTNSLFTRGLGSRNGNCKS